MRYLTHNDLGQMGLEEAIAWEQLRGLGGLGENGDAVYWSDTHDSPSSGGSDSGALTCRGGSCKPKITKIITYQPPAKVQQTVQQPSSYMVQPGAKYGSSAPPSPSELIGSKMRVYQCGPNGCNIAPEVYPQISAAQIQSYGPQKVIQSLPSAPVKVAPSAAAPVDCNAAFNKWCALNNQFLDAQAMSKWLVDNKFDATAIRAANQRRDGIATQMANMNSQLSSCDRARFALGVAGCGPHVAAAPAVNLPPHLDVPADTNVYAPMPQSLDTTSQDVRPVGFIPEHDLYEKLWAIQQGWGPKPKAPAPAAVPPPVVVPVVPGIPMPAPYASAGSVNLLAPLAPSGIAVRPEAPMQVIQPSVAQVRNLDVQAQEVRSQIKDYEAQSRGPNSDPAAEEAAYKLRKVLASIEANKKAIMAPSGRPTTLQDTIVSVQRANRDGILRMTEATRDFAFDDVRQRAAFSQLDERVKIAIDGVAGALGGAQKTYNETKARLMTDLIDKTVNWNGSASQIASGLRAMIFKLKKDSEAVEPIDSPKTLEEYAARVIKKNIDKDHKADLAAQMTSVWSAANELDRLENDPTAKYAKVTEIQQRLNRFLDTAGKASSDAFSRAALLDKDFGAALAEQVTQETDARLGLAKLGPKMSSRTWTPAQWEGLRQLAAVGERRKQEDLAVARAQAQGIPAPEKKSWWAAVFGGAGVAAEPQKTPATGR